MVSDIHGNLTAFEAVLADIDARGIERVVGLGDVVGKGPRGSECVRLSRERCTATVRGNWDTIIAGPPEQLWPTGHWVRDRLTAEDVDWLAGLPNCLDLVVSGQHVRLVHASPVSEFHRVMRDHSVEDFRAMFVNTAFTGDGPVPTVVGYGDIHQTFLRARDGLTLFNAGSVGNHLDGPTAPYVVLEGELDSPCRAPFGVSFVRVPYDIESEITAAGELGMPDTDAYALELREGVYRGRRRGAG